MPSVHHFRELSTVEREEGQSRTMLVHYDQLAPVLKRAVSWLWYWIAAGVVAFLVLVMIVLAVTT